MRAGRTAEADALALHIRTAITCRSTKWLRNIDTRKCAKDVWSKVREIIYGEGKRDRQVDGLTAQVLNDHYTAISTDCYYQVPSPKLIAQGQAHFIGEMEVFRQLVIIFDQSHGT